MCDTVIPSTYCARLLYDCILCVVLLYQVLIVPDCCMYIMCDTVISSTYCTRLLYVFYVIYCYTKYLLCQTVVCILHVCVILLYQVLIVPDCCMYITCMCDTVIPSTYCARLLYVYYV